MKTCDVCGTYNLKNNNYCTHCGCKIVLENFCPFCGTLNPDASSECVNCHKEITPISIDSYDVLFTSHFVNLLYNANISDYDYVNILIGMFKKLDFLNIEANTPKEKILVIAESFTDCVPKSKGAEFGETKRYVISYDDRLDESMQISTIIHELAHYLLFELVLNMLCKILNIKSSEFIRCVVHSFLTSPKMELLNEYYAHTVENRFTPHEFQNFGSFKFCLKNLEISDDELAGLMVIANSYSTDIIHFLEKYVDYDLRKEIKLQYKKDLKIPEPIEQYSIEDMVSISEKNRTLFSLLFMHLDEVISNKEAGKEVDCKE